MGGKCPKVNYMDQSNFKPQKYSGNWYEIVRDWTNPMTLSTDCVTKEFAPYDSKLGKMDLYFRGLYGWWIGYMGANGALWQCDQSLDTKATCMATMGATMGKSDKRSPFNILDTDYDNY